MSSDGSAPRPRRWPPAPQRPVRIRPRLAEHPAPPPPVPPPAGPGAGTDRGTAWNPGRNPRRDAPGLGGAAGRPPRLPALPAALPARRADAGALAAAFGVDFLSWDEGDPQRRGRALAPYAVPPAAEDQLAAAGWPGSGRQRGELALPGAVVALAEDRLLVHVRVRVTPFRRLAGAATGVRHSADVLPYPAAAPAPADPAWVGLDSYWYELLVPVREVADQWRVDIAAVIVVPPVGGAVGVVPP